MGLNEDFHNAVTRSKGLSERPSNEELLELYGLYKQGTLGDNNESRPAGFDFKAIAKHEAWMKHRGKNKDQAKREYTALVERLSQRQ